MKKNFVRYRQPKKKGPGFWNQEYKKGGNFAISNEPSEDLTKFANFLERIKGRAILNPTVSVLDMGCGNGRNLIYLAVNYNVHGVGYDISSEGIAQAQKRSANLPLAYETRTIAGTIPLPDKSQTLVLDMMTSHFLKESERAVLLSEIVRVLKPGGWFFFKTFLKDEDIHTKRLLADHPGTETGTYIHPRIGVAEYVPTEQAVIESLTPYFTIHKVIKSHRHKGSVAKRRSICIYAERI